MVADAQDLAGLVPQDGMWAWAFKALACVQGRQWQHHRAGVREAWADAVALKGADSDPGTMGAAIWMGRAVVRLACTFKLMPLDEVPQAIQEECGVRQADVVADAPASKKAAPKGRPKRKRDTRTVVDVETKGGPVTKKARDEMNGDKEDSEATLSECDRPAGSGSHGGGGNSNAGDDADHHSQASGGGAGAGDMHQPTPVSQWASCGMTAGMQRHLLAAPATSTRLCLSKDICMVLKVQCVSQYPQHFRLSKLYFSTRWPHPGD